MTGRPYTILSCAVSLDGYLDDAGERRLLLSGEEDFDRVDEVRAGCDAILVGAATIRRDDPRLIIRSPARRAARVARGAPPDPLRVTLTGTGDLDPGRRFFAPPGNARPGDPSPGDARPGDPPPGDARPAPAALVYAPAGAAAALAARLGARAAVVAAADLPAALADLRHRGVRRLLVEGGGRVLTQFLTGGLADELHLAVAPVFVGDSRAPRFLHSGAFPAGRLVLAETRPVGDVALLRYLVSAAAVDRHWLGIAADEARRCPPSGTAFSVGAVIVDASGREIARGYSRETDPYVHAEEAALAKVESSDPRLRTATLYSSLEPCSQRASRARPCAALIRAAGLPRVVYAWREPDLFVDGHGVEELRAAGVEVVEVADLAGAVRAVNAHLLSS